VDPASHARSLWTGTLAVVLVEDHRADRPRVRGLLSAFNHDARNQHAHLGMLRAGSEHTASLADIAFVEGAALFVDWLFADWPLRKLYAHMPGPAFDRVASGRHRLFVEEAVLRDHRRIGRDLVDEHVLALTRERWDTVGRSWLRRLVTPRPGRRGT
jgi:hypothetical protein